MVLQVFIDDSSQDGVSLVLAGYISTTEKWAEFSTEWQSLLDRDPPWLQFKMSRIFNSIKHHHLEPWASDRVVEHYRIIEKHVKAGISVMVPRETLTSVVKDMSLPKQISNPYYLAWRAIISLLLDWQVRSGSTETVDFIFDCQTESTLMMQAWKEMASNLPEKMKEIVPNFPIFRRDEDFLPLQAADMLAWWTRRRHTETGTTLVEGVPFPWGQTRDGPEMLLAEFDRRSMMKQFRKDKEAVMRGTNRVLRLSVTWKYVEDSLVRKPSW